MSGTLHPPPAISTKRPFALHVPWKRAEEIDCGNVGPCDGWVRRQVGSLLGWGAERLSRGFAQGVEALSSRRFGGQGADNRGPRPCTRDVSDGGGIWRGSMASMRRGRAPAFLGGSWCGGLVVAAEGCYGCRPPCLGRRSPPSDKRPSRGSGPCRHTTPSEQPPSTRRHGGVCVASRHRLCLAPGGLAAGKTGEAHEDGRRSTKRNRGGSLPARPS